MVKKWKEDLFNIIMLDFLRAKGFSKVNRHAFEMLKEVFREKNKQMIRKLKKYAEMNQRMEASVFDVIHVLESNKVDLKDLTEYVELSGNKFRNTEMIVKSKLKRSEERVSRINGSRR